MVKHIEQVLKIGKRDLKLIDKILDKAGSDVKVRVLEFIETKKPSDIDELMRGIRGVLAESYREMTKITDEGQDVAYKESYTGNDTSIPNLEKIDWSKSFDKLTDKLQTTILQGMYTKKNNREIMRDIQNRFDISKRAAQRIVRTEYVKASNIAEMETYQNLGIEYYEFYNVIDNRTCDVCNEMNGQIFKVSEAQIGINMPPLHPNCRATTLSVRNDDPRLKNLK